VSSLKLVFFYPPPLFDCIPVTVYHCISDLYHCCSDINITATRAAQYNIKSTKEMLMHIITYICMYRELVSIPVHVHVCIGSLL